MTEQTLPQTTPAGKLQVLKSRPLTRGPAPNGGYPAWKLAVLLRCKAEEIHRLYWVERNSYYRISRLLGVSEPTVKKALDLLDRFGTEIAETGSFDCVEKEIFKTFPHYKETDFYNQYVLNATWPPQKKRGPKPGSRRKPAEGQGTPDQAPPGGGAVEPAPPATSPVPDPAQPPQAEPPQSGQLTLLPPEKSEKAKARIPSAVAAAMARHEKPEHL